MSTWRLETRLGPGTLNFGPSEAMRLLFAKLDLCSFNGLSLPDMGENDYWVNWI